MRSSTTKMLFLSALLLACQSSKEPAPSSSKSSKKSKSELWKERSDKAGSLKKKGKANSTFAGSLTSDPFKECNYDPDSEKADFKAVTLNSTDAKMVGDGWEIMGKATAAFSGTTSPLKLGFNFNVVSGKPAAAVTIAKKETARFANDSSITIVSNDEAAQALGRSLNTPTCGVLMTNKVQSVSKTTGENMTVTLDQPIPFMLSPLLTAQRANYELENGIKIENVTGEVSASDPKANGPQTGTAELFLVDETASVTDTTGKQTVFDADYAYGVVIHFDGNNVDADLGVLDQVNYYYVKGGAIIGMVTEVPREELPILVFTK